jgi:hypothetical protein
MKGNLYFMKQEFIQPAFMEKRLPGVYPQRKKDQTVYYRSSFTYKQKHISLGSFATMVEAHHAYLEAHTLTDDRSLGINDYLADVAPRILSFDKWVCIINFRDNNLYFSTPIYMRLKYFEYYLSPNVILKFDIDDLFYYSTRSIMQRGRHLFVSDYGMQVNIMNRYGIKNYAVLNRDYRFINEDCQDFRYENIEIINRYHGVRAVNREGRLFYRVRIHIVGNVTVGTYPSETEAAIAYNKAIDILKKAGVGKNYTPNYLDGLSPFVYADIYSRIKVSSKIVNYRPE